MFAFLLLSTDATLGYLSVVAGFLVIVASVVFVIKGKAVLGESGAPNAVEWGKIKTSLTSAVALFVLGAALIALPLWLSATAEEKRQEEDAQRQAAEAKLRAEKARQPAQALLTGKINGGGDKDLRLLLVVKPYYDQNYSGDISWQIPLLATAKSYALFYIDCDSIVGQQVFSVGGAEPGSPDQTIPLPPWDLHTHNSTAPMIRPTLEVSDAELAKLNLR